VNDFLLGGAAVAYAAVALFFFRSWRQTRDPLFVAFAVAFAIFAASRVVMASVDRESESLVLVYVLRLAAFLTLIAAIVSKNRARE
jgi:hypothetical protein